MKKVSLLFFLFLFFCASYATTYYSQGSLDAKTLSSWNDARLGGGASPANFTAGDIFVVQNGHSMTTSAAFTISGTGNKLQIESGGTLTATFIIAVTTFQVDNGGTYIHNAPGSSTNGASTDFPGTTGTGRVFGATSNVEIRSWGVVAGSSPASLPTIASPGWGNLTLNYTGPAGSVQMSGVLTAIQGNFTITATGNSATREFRLTSTANFTLAIGGNLTVNGGYLTLTSSTGIATVNVAGDVFVSNGTLAVGVASGSVATLNVNGTAPSSTGTLSLSGGLITAISSATHTLNLAGDLLISGGSYNLVTSGSSTSSANINVNGTAAGTTGKILLSGAGGIAQGSSTPWTITTKGNFEMTGTSTFLGNAATSSGRNQILNVGGNLSLAGGSFIMSNSSSTGSAINFTGGASAVTFSNSGTFTITGVQIVTVAAAKTLTLNTDWNIAAAAHTFTVNGTLNCATNKIGGVGIFTLGASGTLKIGSVDGISSTASTGSIQSTATRTFPTTANYEYNGSAAQVTGNQLPATVNNLTINNNNNVTLSSACAVTNALGLSAGKLILGANNISTASVTGASGSNYIVTNGTGSLKINGVAGSAFFPIGSSTTVYNPITLNNSGTSDNFSVKVQPTFSNAPFDATKVVNAQWTVAEDVAGGSILSITPQWNSSDEAASFSRGGSLVIAQFGSGWVETATAGVSGSDPYTTNASGFTSVSTFGVGNANSFYSTVPPNVALSSSNPSLPSSNVYTSSIKNPIYTFTLAATTNSAILNALDITTTGTYAATDITKLQLWYNSSNNLTTATQIGSDISTSLGTGLHSFNGLSQVIGNGATGYFWVTTDIAGGATLANNISVTAVSTTDITLASGSKSGTAFNSGTFTITINSNATDYFRTVVPSGDWSNINTWESSTDNLSWHSASLVPGSSATNTLIQSGNTVTISSAVTIANTTITGEVDITSAGSLTVASGKVLTVDGTLDNASTSTTAIVATGTINFNSGSNYKLSGSGTSGQIPAATWNSNSNLYLNGTFTASTNLTTNGGSVYGNMFVTANVTGTLVPFTPASIQRIAGNLTVSTTGTGVLQLISSNGTNIFTVDGNYSQTSGIVLMNPSNYGATTFRPMTVKGNFSIDGCTFRVSGGSANCYLIIKGNFSANNAVIDNSGGAGTAGSSAYIHLAGDGAQTYSWTGTRSITAATNPINFVVNSGTVLDMGTSIIDGGANITFANSAAYTAPTLTADLTSGNNLIAITGGTSLTGIQPGMPISGGSIPSNTFVTAVYSGTQLQISKAPTATTTGVTLTFSSKQSSAIKTSAAAGLNGNIANAGTKTFALGTSYEFYGSASSAVTGSLLPATVSNLTFNNSAGITLGSDVSVTGNVVVASGSLVVSANKRLTIPGSGNFNANLVILKSDASGTASLGTIGGTLSGATNVSIERYIPGGRRTYRFFGNPFSNPIMLNQLMATNGANTGIDITGNSGGANGFTTTPTNNPSAFSYDVSLGNSATLPVDPGWQPFASASSTLWIAKQGIRVLVRGTKGEGLNGNPYTPSATTVTLNGTLNDGTGTAPVFSLTSGANSGYNLIANPLASQIDMQAVTRGGTNVGANFYVWDATSSTYANEPFATASTYRYLPIASSFFATTTSTGNITFPESAKAANAPASLFRGTSTYGPNSIQLELNDNAGFRQDRILFFLNNNASDNLDGNDGVKMNNPSVNFYANSADSKKLSIDARPFAINSIVPLTLNTPADKDFVINVLDFNVDDAREILLHDKKTNTYTTLNAGVSYSFSSLLSDATTYGDRFELVMKASNALPTTFLSVAASAKNSGIEVTWSTANESNMNGYEVEESIDGVNFTKAFVVSAKNTATNTYNCFDATVVNGNKYYRIKAIEKSGASKYSNVVKVKVGDKTSEFAVYPNPVKGGIVNLQMNNVEKGSYTIRIFNNLGQEVASKNILYTGGSVTQTIDLGKSITAGSYRMQISNEIAVITKTIIVE